MTDLEQKKKAKASPSEQAAVSDERSSRDRTYLSLMGKNVVSFTDSFINGIFTDETLARLDLAYANVQEVVAKLNGLIAKYLVLNESLVLDQAIANSKYEVLKRIVTDQKVSDVIRDYARMCLLRKVLAGDNVVGIWDNIEQTSVYTDFDKRLFALCKSVITDQYSLKNMEIYSGASKAAIRQGVELLTPVGAAIIYESLKSELIPEFFSRLAC